MSTRSPSTTALAQSVLKSGIPRNFFRNLRKASKAIGPDHPELKAALLSLTQAAYRWQDPMSLHAEIALVSPKRNVACVNALNRAHLAEADEEEQLNVRKYCLSRLATALNSQEARHALILSLSEVTCQEFSFKLVAQHLRDARLRDDVVRFANAEIKGEESNLALRRACLHLLFFDLQALDFEERLSPLLSSQEEEEQELRKYAQKLLARMHNMMLYRNEDWVRNSWLIDYPYKSQS